MEWGPNSKCDNNSNKIEIRNISKFRAGIKVKLSIESFKAEFFIFVDAVEALFDARHSTQVNKVTQTKGCSSTPPGNKFQSWIPLNLSFLFVQRQTHRQLTGLSDSFLLLVYSENIVSSLLPLPTVLPSSRPLYRGLARSVPCRLPYPSSKLCPYPCCSSCRIYSRCKIKNPDSSFVKRKKDRHGELPEAGKGRRR